ncbi:MAG: hypothetical protein ACP5HH_05135 [Fervidicoccaceae archaeon]
MSGSSPEDECSDISEGLGEKSREKAKKAAKEGRVVLVYKEPEIAFFLGTDGDYVVVPYTYCSCKDFSLNVIARKRRKACYHMLSYCLSKSMGTLVEHQVRDRVELTSFVRETLLGGRAEGLRKLINITESSRKGEK